MKNKQSEIIKCLLGIDLSEKQINDFTKYEKCFLEKNSRINLISKNDEKFLFEKHIFDSLAINKFFQKNKSTNFKKLLDIGTGGGFPSVPIAILFEDINVYAIDSIRKKINVIEELKVELELKNLFPICDRAENLKKEEKFDLITTRAVAEMDIILKYALAQLKQGGYFIAYKSKKALEELNSAQKTLKLMNAEIVEIIEYSLPLEEIYERNLIIVQKK